MKKIISLIFFVCSLINYAQTPCDNGMAGSYPCNGYDLQSFIPFSTFNASSGNDSWGWTDPQDGKEYALMGLNNGTVFIDISDPINPIYLGKLPTHTSSTTWRDVKVYNNYAFVVSEAGGHGMQVFDLTRLRDVANPPETFTEDAHYDGFGDAHNIVINEETGYAYGVGADYSGGAHFINIQDPLNPVGEGGYAGSGYTHDAQVITYNGPDTDYTGREIYIGSNESFVTIVDVTDKSNPVLIANATYSNDSYTHQGWLSEDLNYFILGDELDEQNFGFNTKTIVFDFSDLDNPQFEFDYFGTTSAIDHNGYTKNNKYYLANYTAGMRVFDISDLENQNISELGYFDTFPSNNSANFSGAWNVYPYFESGNIVISNYSGGGFFLVKSNAVDSTSPLAVCQNITVELDDNGTVTVTAETIDGGSSDNVGITSFELNLSTFTCNELGDNNVILTVFDAAGNSASCDAIITVLDTISPTVIGQNITADLAGNPSVTVSAAEVDDGSFDNCSITNLSLSPNTFDSTGIFEAVLEGTDIAGNSENVTVEITIIDTVDSENPIAVCQNFTAQLDENGLVTITADTLDGGSSDNVEITSFEISVSTFTCNEIGDNEVILTVFDAAGNSASCVAIVTIEDITPPTIIGQDITVNLDGNPSVTVLAIEVDNGSFDNCSIETLTLSPDIFTTVGVYDAILEGTDSSGNSENTTVEITIIDTVDNENPIAVCQDFTVELDENGSITISGDDVDGGSSDNSGFYTLTIDINTFDCSNIGENEVTLTVTDPSENIDTCVAIITVEDNLAPVIICPDDQLIEAGPDGTVILPDYVANNEVTATDNCTDNLTIVQDPAAGTILGMGSNTITFITTDSSGNENMCSFELEVLVLGLNDNELNKGLSIYPNPSSNMVTVNSKTDLLTSISVFDINGKQILDINTINSETKTLDISNFSNGIYFMTINNEVTKKLIKI
jgi:choice-of-anchor B domain-containing protein